MKTPRKPTVITLDRIKYIYAEAVSSSPGAQPLVL